MALDAVGALQNAEKPAAQPLLDALGPGVLRGREWLMKVSSGGKHFPPAPIGFYFAKLWYSEREYPLIQCVAGMSRISLSPDCSGYNGTTGAQ